MARYLLLGVSECVAGGWGAISAIFFLAFFSTFWVFSCGRRVAGMGRSFLVDFCSPISVVFRRISFPSIRVNSFQKFSPGFLVLGSDFFLFGQGGF